MVSILCAREGNAADCGHTQDHGQERLVQTLVVSMQALVDSHVITGDPVSDTG